MADKETITSKDVGEMPKGIVEAVGTAGARGGTGSEGYTGADIEKAMGDAAQACFDAGITDPDTIREVKLYARGLITGKIKADPSKPSPLAVAKAKAKEAAEKEAKK